MKSSENFKKVIQSFLEDKAKNDLMFTQRFNNPSKDINECISFVLHKVKESGCNGFTDEEIYGLALHYYDEDKLDPIAKIDQSRIVVNHVVELSEADKKEAHQLAMKKAIADQYGKLTSRQSSKNKTAETPSEQASLF